MKLVGELKKQVEGTNNKEEAKELMEDAGMLLTDDELDYVTGGVGGTDWADWVDVAGKAGAAGKAGKVSKKVIK